MKDFFVFLAGAAVGAAAAALVARNGRDDRFSGGRQSEVTNDISPEPPCGSGDNVFFFRFGIGWLAGFICFTTS